MKDKQNLTSIFMNWMSLVGIFMAGFGIIAGSILLIMDLHSASTSAYFGVFIYMVIPSFIFFGLFLIIAGVLLNRSRINRKGKESHLPVIDLSNPKTFKRFIIFCLGLSFFIIVSSVGIYRTYHFTESVKFCGQLCHTVMNPEYVAFENSPHANVTCTKCHIGPGADWFVQSKMSGLYQVYSTLFNKYDRPIETPIKDLRPAEETCYTCHWPQKFFGSLLKSWTYFLTNDTNSPWTIKMILPVGGGDPRERTIKGIHWHMKEANAVEYIASDDKRLIIPWVSVKDQNGRQTIYKSSNNDKALTKNMLLNSKKRQMDCIDCHNRPTHQFDSPSDALDKSIIAGKISPELKHIKKTAAQLLAKDYTTKEQGLANIKQELTKTYGTNDKANQAIKAIQEIYRQNFFPQMKVDWRVYPDHIGHKITPGCFRCHDGKHVSEDGLVISNKCNTCHTIIAQGPGTDLHGVTSNGLEFKHPVDIGGAWQTTPCHLCHTGQP